MFSMLIDRTALMTDYRDAFKSEFPDVTKLSVTKHGFAIVIGWDTGPTNDEMLANDVLGKFYFGKDLHVPPGSDTSIFRLHRKGVETSLINPLTISEAKCNV